MRFYEKLISKPIPIALFVLGFIVLNPFHTQPDKPAVSSSKIAEEQREEIFTPEWNPQTTRVYAKTQLDNYGFNTPEEWTCLNRLWGKESAWNYQSVGITHDFGIPQRHMADKEKKEQKDFLDNPVIQIKWGLKYITHRYSTPCSAWRFWQDNHWY